MIVMGGWLGGGDENRSWKNQTNVFYYFGSIFCHPSSVLWWLRFGGRMWLGDKNDNQKNRAYVFDIFLAMIFVTQFPPPFHQQFWEFKIIKTVWRRLKIANSRVVRFLWVNSQKCWTKTQYHEFWGSCDCDGGGGWGIEWQKSWMKKLKMSVRFFWPRFSSPNFPRFNRRILESWYCVFVQHVWEFVFIFLVVIFVIQFPPLQLLDPRINDIASSPTFLRI